MGNALSVRAGRSIWTAGPLASATFGTAGAANGADTDSTVAATPGTWTATAWGGAASDASDPTTPNSEARPTGVYGAFNANFTNGAAVGVYSTR